MTTSTRQSTMCRLWPLLALLSQLAAVPGWAGDQGVTADKIVLGQSTALTGPLGDLGQEVLKGSKAYFAQVNAHGGINGRKIELVTHDDGYEVAKTVANVQAFIAADNVFCLFNVFGTPNNEAIVPLAEKAGIPVVASYSGAPSIRGKELKEVVNVRASYADEAERLVEHLTTVGTHNIAIAYQNNSFGKEVLAAAVASLKARGMQPLITVSVESSAADAPAAADKIVAANPEAVLLALAGKPTIEIIRDVKKGRRGQPMYALSVLATPSNLKALGPDGQGVAISQVVPFPTNTTMALIREYQEAMKQSGETEFDHLSLEGYINAKVMAEGLRRAGRNPTRASFMAAIAAMHGLSLGGIDLSFDHGAQSGSHFVELTMVNGQGKLIR